MDVTLKVAILLILLAGAAFGLQKLFPPNEKDKQQAQAEAERRRQRYEAEEARQAEAKARRQGKERSKKPAQDEAENGE